MEILRAKTRELFKSKLNAAQAANSRLNLEEIEAFLHSDSTQRERERSYLRSYPRRIVLEMTNACNVKCIFCGRDEAEFNRTYLSPEVLDWLAPALQHCEEVTLFGWGEPTINPQFSEFLRRLAPLPVRKYFVTNGTRLDRLVDDIFNYHVDIIAVSLDGPDAATNDRIRVGARFERIVAGIRAIQRRKAELEVDFPYMNFVFVAMRSNIARLREMVDLAKDLGMQEVKVVFLTAFSQDMLAEVLYDAQEVVREAFDQATARAAELNIQIKLPYIQGEDIAGEHCHKDCFVAWRDFFVGSDDSLRPCQSTSLKLGRLSDFESFEQAWNSPAFREFRLQVNCHAPHDGLCMPLQCKLCYQSSHANWNRRQSFIQVDQIFAPEWDKQSSIRYRRI